MHSQGISVGGTDSAELWLKSAGNEKGRALERRRAHISASLWWPICFSQVHVQPSELYLGHDRANLGMSHTHGQGQ